MKKLLLIPILLFWCASVFAVQPTRETRFAQAGTHYLWDWRFCPGTADICFGQEAWDNSWSIGGSYYDAVRVQCTESGTSLKMRLLTDGAGSGTIRMALYSDKAAGPQPLALLWEGTDQTYVADSWIEEAASIVLAAETWYWLGIKNNSSGKIVYWDYPESYPYQHRYSTASYADPFPDPWPNYTSGNDNMYVVQICIGGGVAETYSGKFPRGIGRGIIR